ncbi:hypothetical protein B6U90_04030 [Thermoplasmatales archaeon ex4484_6]|nr:MAG: hypothetical protein B6U90_04030 [Thermoplasmatales archaeon ex4484_6]
MGNDHGFRKGSSILLPIALVFIMAIPAAIIGQGEKDAPVSSPIGMQDDFNGVLDLSSIVLEQNAFGDEYQDWAGYVVKKAYINNDMNEDLIISAPGYNNTRGGVFIYYGWSEDRELSLRDADVRIDGQREMGFFGLNVECGDVNNDGMVDILVSGFKDTYINSHFTTLDNFYPEVYLFLGESVWDSEIHSLDADVIFIGQDPSHGFGWDIELGDVTSDGYDDVVISEYLEDSSGYHGWVYVWEGKMALEPTYNVSLGEYDHRIFTSNSTMEGGVGYWGIASSDLTLGDVNGDGYQDIIMGSDMVNSRGMGSGEAEVVFGSRNLPAEIDLMTYSYVRVESFPGYGLSMVAITDFDGDGIDDLIVCAPYGFFDHKGGIFIFYGDLLMPTGTLSILDYDFLFRGPSPYWGFGVKGIDDLNGDGRGDLIIQSDNGVDNDGKGCYCIIYSNSTDSLYDPIYYMQFETPDFIIKGITRNTLFGNRYLDNLVFLDYYGNNYLEIVASAPMGAYGDNPPESGVVMFHYQIMSEIVTQDFELLDADGPDGNILGAEKTYHFMGYVRNTWSIDDFKTLDFTFLFHGGVMEGKMVILKWDRGLMAMDERSDPDDYLEIVSSSFNPDGNNGMWIYFNISFHTNIPTEEFIDLIVDIVGGRGDMGMTLSYPSLFKVEPDVDFAGELTVIGEYNGILSKGSYVRPNEKIVVTGIKAVYEGTEAPPPNDYFGIKMTDNIGNVFLNSSSSGKEIYFTYRTQEIAGREEINITFVDLAGESDNAAGLMNFFYIVDTDAPEPPEEIVIRADSDIDTLVGFDNDPEVFITWNPSFDETSEVIGYMYSPVDGGGTDQGTFTENTQVVFDGLKEGLNSIYIWSVDSAHNYGPSQVATVFYDTDMPTFGMPDPAPGSWVNSNTVNYEMVIMDRDGSGVRGSSVEYAISFDGGRTYSAWEPTNIRNEGEQIRVKVFLNFREGDENYIKWRAKDISGNGYIVSDPFQVKVDTVPLSYKNPIPSEPVSADYITCGVTLTDIGSGVDASTIQYSISYDGVSNYGPWETLDLSGLEESIDVTTPPIYFERGTLNYIKWRAMDGAGNGYTYSADVPIDVLPEEVNKNPVPIISYPKEQVKYLESQKILFDGSKSIDPNGDELKYLWYSDKDGYLSTDPVFEKRLSQANHLITLHVDDGIENRSISVRVSVIPDPTAIDTDEDGIPDFNDDDDDNDGLLDIQEDINKNGLIDFDLNETDPKNPDTDGDGYNDYLDVRPLNPDVTEPKDESHLSIMVSIIVFVLVIIAFIVAALLFIMKQRVDKKGLEARRKLRRTRRNLRRFEVLTGVPTNDLPAIEAVQWALPAVINEASEFMLESVESEDLLPQAPEEEEEKGEEQEVEKPDLEDLEVPEPAVPAGGEMAEEVPGPEAPSMPESEGAPSGGEGSVINCSLCGSEISVPEGATSVECPLCGEINTL